VSDGGDLAQDEAREQEQREEWHRGAWMQTFTGGQFFPTDPRPEDVHPADIAHALSMLCRFAGHVDRFYSVAEHCVLLSRWAESTGDLADPLEMLLHDATEAYVVDVPRPLKRSLPEYQRIEARVATAIAQRFGTIEDADTVDGEVVDSLFVKEADTRILLDERAALMSATRYAWDVDGLEPLGVAIEAWRPEQAEAAYLDRLIELGVDW
jgi:5'-deoxynucleotidase YfbR-like HD superfamily hydrolase